MKLTWHIPVDHRHEEAVANFRSRSGPRIGWYVIDNKGFWIKSIDRPGLINRLQKGPPLVAFNADLAAMKSLSAMGVPVPEIIGEGPGLVITRDGGPTLEYFLREQAGSVDERIEAFSTAGATLAWMHSKGISHGRPVLRDMCWRNSRLTILDLENYRPDRNQPKHFRLDLVIFVFSCYAQQRDELPEIVAAKTAYRANDTGGIWQMAVDWLEGKRWVDTVTKPLQWQRDPHARDLKAIAPTLRAFLN